MHALDPHLPLLGLGTLRETVRRGLGAIPMLAPILGGLGLLALGLCALGIYSVMAQNVIGTHSGNRYPTGPGRDACNGIPLVLRGGLRLAGWGLGTGCRWRWV
jgi:hypothetical protein